MRSSVIKTDPGYRRHTFGTVITLDGVPVQKCITADEELGEVLCYALSAAGVVELDDTGKELRKVTRRGVVVITPPKGQKKPKRRRFVRMFKPRFAGMVAAGEKRQTVRPTPERLPAPGDVIDCREWTGAPYRSKQRTLLVGMVTKVETITITAAGTTASEDRDEFARADGFTNFADLRDWFLTEHGLPFTGVCIYWK